MVKVIALAPEEGPIGTIIVGDDKTQDEITFQQWDGASKGITLLVAEFDKPSKSGIFGLLGGNKSYKITLKNVGNVNNCTSVSSAYFYDTSTKENTKEKTAGLVTLDHASEIIFVSAKTKEPTTDEKEAFAEYLAAELGRVASGNEWAGSV